MYEAFYGFQGDPFRLTPDSRFCFAHRSFRKARAYLEYGIQRSEGFVVVTGEPGSGKTTLLEYLLAEYDLSGINVIRLLPGRLADGELVRLLAYELGMDARGLDQATLLRESLRRLEAVSREGRRSVLIVDEAQGLSEESLEELRALTNFQDGDRPLLQVFLLGQPKLRELLQRPSLEQLQQRLIAACRLEPLTVEETQAYVEHRLRLVGWRPGRPAIDARLYGVTNRATGGIPRRVNHVMSRLCMHGYVEGRMTLGPEDMRAVLEELGDDHLLPAGCDVEWMMVPARAGGGPASSPEVPTQSASPYPPRAQSPVPSPRRRPPPRRPGPVSAVPASGAERAPGGGGGARRPGRRAHHPVQWVLAAVLVVLLGGGGVWWAVNGIGAGDRWGRFEVPGWLSLPGSVELQRGAESGSDELGVGRGPYPG